MRSHVLVLCVLSFATRSVLAQTAVVTAKNQAAFEFAQKAAVRALHFTQGDAESLRRARADFTSQAWNELMKQMQGFIDDNGVPAFSSNFVPSGKAVVIGEEEGMIHRARPGQPTTIVRSTSRLAARQ